VSTSRIGGIRVDSISKSSNGGERRKKRTGGKGFDSGRGGGDGSNWGGRSHGYQDWE